MATCPLLVLPFRLQSLGLTGTTTLKPLRATPGFPSPAQYDNSGASPFKEQSFLLLTYTLKIRLPILPPIGVLAQTKAIPSAMPALDISFSRTSASLHMRIHAPRRATSRHSSISCKKRLTLCALSMQTAFLRAGSDWEVYFFAEL
ncbi:hypothetical protein B0H11DRAFT_1937935 [Mycena galericulata]|nr:hypothetical protein B0H11DRAFT_1937935 [Mycena galericulata]